jgi:hypothetical protein
MKCCRRVKADPALRKENADIEEFARYSKIKVYQSCEW